MRADLFTALAAVIAAVLLVLMCTAEVEDPDGLLLGQQQLEDAVEQAKRQSEVDRLSAIASKQERAK